MLYAAFHHSSALIRISLRSKCNFRLNLTLLIGLNRAGWLPSLLSVPVVRSTVQC